MGLNLIKKVNCIQKTMVPLFSLVILSIGMESFMIILLNVEPVSQLNQVVQNFIIINWKKSEMLL
jgi:hypothetical protein